MGGCLSVIFCSNSCKESSNGNANIYEVTNINVNGDIQWNGKLELTKTDLIVHRKRREPIQWPLKCVRRYGCDTDVFQIEVGRRCVTGEGTYAFKCHQAETLIQTLESYIQMSLIVDASDSNSTARLSAKSPESFNNTFETVPSEPSTNTRLNNEETSCSDQQPQQHVQIAGNSATVINTLTYANIFSDGQGMSCGSSHQLLPISSTQSNVTTYVNVEGTMCMNVLGNTSNAALIQNTNENGNDRSIVLHYADLEIIPNDSISNDTNTSFTTNSSPPTPNIYSQVFVLRTNEVSHLC